MKNTRPSDREGVFDPYPYFEVPTRREKYEAKPTRRKHIERVTYGARPGDDPRDGSEVIGAAETKDELRRES